MVSIDNVPGLSTISWTAISANTAIAFTIYLIVRTFKSPSNENMKNGVEGRKKYVVVGGGWFGIRAVRAIESISKDSEIIVLEKGSKDYLDIVIANPRLAVEPELIEKAYQPLSKVCQRAKLINIQKLKEISSGKVTFTNAKNEEQTLHADGIIIATGATYSSRLMKDSFGKSKEERKAEFIQFRDAVQNSKSGVLVIGGGTTGVELAGEVKTDFPHVKCTLLSKSDLLLRGCSKRKDMHKSAMRQLNEMGVEVINGDYIEGFCEDYIGEGRKFTTKNGVEIEADVVVACAGGRPNIAFPVGDALDLETKGLSVNGAMLCEKLGPDHSKPIWALGDCTMYGGRGIFADPQIAAFTASIQHFERTGTTKGGPMKYKHKMSDQYPSCISIGRQGGAFSEPFVNEFMAKLVKAPDLMLSLLYRFQFKVKI